MPLVLMVMGCGDSGGSPFPVVCGEFPPTELGEPSLRSFEPPGGSPPFDVVVYRYNCAIDGTKFVEQRWRRDPTASCPDGEFGWVLDSVYQSTNLNCS